MRNATLAVSIIIHDDFTYVGQLLSALLEDPTNQLEVHVTVNSGNQSDVNELMGKFPRAYYTVNASPAGFAHNHNQIMKRAQTEFVALLNDDISIDLSTIGHMVDFLNTETEVGLATPRVLNVDGSPQITAFSDPSLVRMLYRISGLGYFTQHGGVVRSTMQKLGISRRLDIASLVDSTETRLVPVVVGVAMFVRRAAYEQAGLMDEATLVYGEEYAWHWRLRQYGWRIAVVGNAIVIHHNVSQDLSGWKLTEHRKGILNYYVRYRPFWQSALIRLSMIGLHGVRGIFTALTSPKQSRAEWDTVRMALTWRPTQSDP